MNGAKEYVKAHGLQSRDATDVIEEFSDEIANMSGVCLDIGCGPAVVTRDLFLPRLPKDATIVGADISKTMIQFAQDEHADEKRLSFINLNIETQNIPQHLVSAYDNAVSFYCLHWCQDVRQVFDNIYQMLRPGGKSLVLFLAHNTGFESYLKLHKDPKYNPYMKDISKYIPYFQRCANPRATLKKIIEESGFEVMHCSYREKTFIFKSQEILKKHVQAVNPFTERMPEHVKKEYEEDLLRDIVSRKFSFIDNNNEGESKDDFQILDRYHVLIAYFKKPTYRIN
ncbi:unnamed protein product [Trichogramma brassicae]|uniref:Methyltransferase type 12 domain-containing protein n=1 Tax=Trichogramma brassicae TaxID=86971 RepID=A0A6H5J1N6_9HYME|nr:unnamed protein product [Trichogramma brassicae]